jgi:acetyl-CoA acyltransferase 1
MNDVVIVSACRTPLCRSRKGGLAHVDAATLLATVLAESLRRTHMTHGGDIDDVCVGNVLGPPASAAAWRMAQLSAGFPTTTSISCVNRQCSSGLQAVAIIANGIAAGNINIGIGCGVESMTNTPMQSMEPPTVDWNAMTNEAMDCVTPMGVTSENVVKDYGLDRRALDQFAVASHQKAAAAQRAGKFQAEIVPVHEVTQDDGIRSDTTYEVLSNLKPVFDQNGVTTAGNSSQTTDGAAAVLLMTRQEAIRRKLPILGIWRGFAVKGVPPRIMGIGPAVAIPAVLKQCGLSVSDIDVFEINEAFASQATWCVEKLKIPMSKVNPNGGAIALGHPLGCTGARLIATLLYEMHRERKRYGVVSMCIGTGMGAAAVIEVEPKAAL